MRKYAYTLLLSFSVAVALLIFGLPGIGGKMRSAFGMNSHISTAGIEGAEAEDGAENVVIETKETPIVLESETMESQLVAKGAVSESRGKIRSDAAVGNFEDTLFIGDSRTVGLAEYADMGEADIFANSGMNIYKLFEEQISVKERGKLTLEEVLESRIYKRIYLMLGINELGYDFNGTTRKFQEVVDKIQSLQPQAVIYLQANLHVTKRKSDNSEIYNNAKIDKLNSFIEGLSDGSSRIYIDINERFDDGTGNLATEYTVDDSHVLGKYYSVWADWIRENSR